jgi:hypothetical protein
LEDFLTSDDEEKIKTNLNSINIKNAIIKLYYSDSTIQENIFKNLSDESKNKIELFCYKVTAVLK